MAKKKEESGFSAEIQSVIEAINSSYGAGSVITMTDTPVAAERVSSGSLKLDALLGGGYPRGKCIEIYGDSSLGKSSMALHFLSQFSGPTLYIDCEQSVDREYAEALGVNMSKMLITQPETLEESCDILVKFLGKVEAIVLDSIAEATPKKELEGDMSTESLGIKAKKMSQLFRLIKATEHNTTILFINQTRERIGVMFGSPITTPGGNASKFGCHVRIDLYGKELISKGSGKDEEILGHKIRTKVVKHKLGIPHLKCEIPLFYDGKGINRSQEIIDLGIEYGVLDRAGSYIKHNGTTVGQGTEQARLFLQDNLEYRDQLEKELLSKIRGL